MAFKIHRSSKDPISEINVTPFVDVMLVLLIIFMVTAPLLTQGVEVDLPEAAAEPIENDTNETPIVLSVDQSGSLYINIGDDGSHLFRDLLAQFYSIGPYILASTYFYQAYYNAHLVRALAQLREQLQIVISMGEYFDHALYGISHTKETIKRGYPLLEAKPNKKLSQKQK